MSGELILKNNDRWKRTLPAVVVTTLVTFGFVLLMQRFFGAEVLEAYGVMGAILIALLTYVVFRSFYPAACSLLHSGAKVLPVPWTLTGTALMLGKDEIRLDNIKMVHCWPNRDALGHDQGGWIVNIETKQGRNRVLCSVDEGSGVADSVERLKELVEALGYRDRWVEE